MIVISWYCRTKGMNSLEQRHFEAGVSGFRQVPDGFWHVSVNGRVCVLGVIAMA